MGPVFLAQTAPINYYMKIVALSVWLYFESRPWKISAQSLRKTVGTGISIL